MSYRFEQILDGQDRGDRNAASSRCHWRILIVNDGLTVAGGMHDNEDVATRCTRLIGRKKGQSKKYELILGLVSG